MNVQVIFIFFLIISLIIYKKQEKNTLVDNDDVKEKDKIVEKDNMFEINSVFQDYDLKISKTPNESKEEFSIKIGKTDFNQARKTYIYTEVFSQNINSILKQYKLNNNLIRRFLHDIKEINKLDEFGIGYDNKIQKIYYTKNNIIKGFKLNEKKRLERCIYNSYDNEEKLKKFLTEKDINFIKKNFNQKKLRFHENNTYKKDILFVKAHAIIIHNHCNLNSTEIKNFINYFKLFNEKSLHEYIEKFKDRTLYYIGINHDKTFTLYIR